MAGKKKPMTQEQKPMTQEQLDMFMSGKSGYEAMGGTKSPRAGRQGLFSRKAEQLMRENPEMFDDMVETKPQKFGLGGDVRYDSKRGQTY